MQSIGRILFTLFLLSSLVAGTACITGEQGISKEDYDSLKNSISQKQLWYREQYKVAGEKKKDSLVQSAEAYLFKTITERVIPCWYNTPWDFYGSTVIPGQGKIACGYFVTTVIQHAGFDIPRVAWAQLASETFMKKLNPQLKRFSSAPIDSVEAWFGKQKDGIYIVGLDNHVGFVVKKEGEVKFIHSSYYQPETGVLKENLKGRNPLNDSRYRVFARILHRDMVINWITGKTYA